MYLCTQNQQQNNNSSLTMASSSKWKGDDDDGARKYKTSWEKQYTWLTEDGQGNSYCKICRKKIIPKLYSIARHEKTGEHCGKIKDIQTMSPANLSSTPRRPVIEKL